MPFDHCDAVGYAAQHDCSMIKERLRPWRARSCGSQAIDLALDDKQSIEAHDRPAAIGRPTELCQIEGLAPGNSGNLSETTRMK